MRRTAIRDTRTAGGRLATGAVRSFHVAGSTGFAGQGSVASGCGGPTAAAAAAAIDVDGYYVLPMFAEIASTGTRYWVREPRRANNSPPADTR